MYCQVYTEVSSLIELCRVQLKVVQLTSSMTASDLVCSILHLLLFLKKYKCMYTYSHKDAPSYMPISISFVVVGHTIARCFANSYLADSFLILNTDCSGLHQQDLLIFWFVPLLVYQNAFQLMYFNLHPSIAHLKFLYLMR